MLEMIILGLAVAAGLYMAMNIGGNDVANAMGTSVGSGALTFKQAILVAAIFEFAGAVLVGSHVTNTIRKGIVAPEAFANHPELLMYGMLAALLAGGLWLQLATALGLPVSTTHSIVGAILGFGIISGGGVNTVAWSKVATIVMSWVISPVMGGLIAFFMFTLVRKSILLKKNPAAPTKRLAPFLIALVIFILVLSFIYKGLKNLHLDLPLGQAVLFAFIAATGAGLLAHFTLPSLERRMNGELKFVERIFRDLQILTACYVAFAHGANDVANSIGPLAAILNIMKTGSVAMKVQVPTWVLAMGGGGIVLGLAIWGRNVIETVGKKITEMTPSRGFSAEFGAATTVLVCSKLGLPISTTHTLVGSVIGVGFARGIAALNLRVIRNIVYSWIITMPVTGVITILLYKLLVLVLV
ncbi:MAG: anion permease [candidate division KSB1 bacterium]|nr:anion permease [candidate division KSB1 bacterium]